MVFYDKNSMSLLQSKGLLQIVFSDAWLHPIYIYTKCMSKAIKVYLVFYFFFPLKVICYCSKFQLSLVLFPKPQKEEKITKVHKGKRDMFSFQFTEFPAFKQYKYMPLGL